MAENEDASFAGGLSDALREALEASTGAPMSDDDESERQDPVSAEPAKEEEETPQEPEPDVEAQPEASEEEIEAEAETAEQEAEPEAEPEDDGADLELPQNLPKELHEKFADLDGKSKQLVLDRFKHLERRADEKFQEAASLRKKADEDLRSAREFDQVLNPYRQHLAEAGLSPAQAVSQVLALRDGLIKDPFAGFEKIVDEFVVRRGDVGTPRAQKLVRQLAQRLKVDLEGLDDYDDAQSAQPTPEALEIAQLRQQISDLQGKFQSSEQSQAEAAKSQAIAAWDRLMADETKPYASRLSDSIVQYVDLPQAQRIADINERLAWAYEQATYTSPEIRQEILNAERAKAREEVLAERKAQEEKARAKVRTVPASKAKAASTTPKTVAPVARAESNDLSLFKHLEKTMDGLSDPGASRI